MSVSPPTVLPVARAGDPAARAEVCARAAAGEEWAIAALPELYYEAVAAKVLASRVAVEDLEDIVQEAFLRTTLACRKGLPELKMPAYTRTIAFNLALNRHGRRRAVSWAEGTPEPRHEVGPDRARDSQDVLRLFSSCLDDLAPPNRMVVERWIGEESTSVPELAQRVGLTEAAVKNIVLRFRKALRLRLVAQGFSL